MQENDITQMSSNDTNMTDRPHTISSAYEKGHQRPQLQPYTFQSPNEQDVDFKKPPVPQRCVSLDSNSSNMMVANNHGMPVKPALPSGKKPTLSTQKPGSLPSFNTNKEDMGKK